MSAHSLFLDINIQAYAVYTPKHPNTHSLAPMHPCTTHLPVYTSKLPHLAELHLHARLHAHTHRTHTHTHTHTHTPTHLAMPHPHTRTLTHTHTHTHTHPHTHLEKLCPTIQKCEQTTCRAIQAEACSHATEPALCTHVDTYIFTNTYVFIHLQKRVLLRLYQPYLQI